MKRFEVGKTYLPLKGTKCRLNFKVTHRMRVDDVIRLEGNFILHDGSNSHSAIFEAVICDGVEIIRGLGGVFFSADKIKN